MFTDPWQSRIHGGVPVADKPAGYLAQVRIPGAKPALKA
jgi:hypothetical protein